MVSMRGNPFASGTFSLGLYTDPAHPAVMLEHLFGQAAAAAAAGVAGLTFSEHHGGVPGYVPTPIQVAGWVLDRIITVWSGPCPLLLPLRSSVLAAEELCWLAALHPGRVSAGFAPGHLASDFELVGADPTTRAGAFTRQLADVAETHSGNPSPMLEHDPAVALTRSHPIAFVAAAGSVTAVRRAAHAGGGIITDSLAPPARAAELFGYDTEAVGWGPTCSPGASGWVHRPWSCSDPRSRCSAPRPPMAAWTTTALLRSTVLRRRWRIGWPRSQGRQERPIVG